MLGVKCDLCDSFESVELDWEGAWSLPDGWRDGPNNQHYCNGHGDFRLADGECVTAVLNVEMKTRGRILGYDKSGYRMLAESSVTLSTSPGPTAYETWVPEWSLAYLYDHPDRHRWQPK
jgi:hypothetical protein